MTCVARIWTKDDDVLAVVSSTSLSTEWADVGADTWHDLCILDASLKASEILEVLTFTEADGVALDGHSIEIISVNPIT